METNEIIKALRKEVAANPCVGLCSACDISECMTRLQIQAADRIEKQDAEIKALRDKVPEWKDPKVTHWMPLPELPEEEKHEK